MFSHSSFIHTFHVVPCPLKSPGPNERDLGRLICRFRHESVMYFSEAFPFTSAFVPGTPNLEGFVAFPSFISARKEKESFTKTHFPLHKLV